jgi:(R,R)-butanediol dehydrogenase/meso-butanediol dehydrogenase/diacetyl reductase
MKALVLDALKKLVVREINDPIPLENQTVVTVVAAGIGGSEYLGFNNPGIRPLPNVMGHGIVGVVASNSMDKSVERVAVYPLSGCGDCQYCGNKQTQLCEQWSLIGVQTQGGFAEKVISPTVNLFPIPDNISWEQAVFIEPFANSVNAWELSQATLHHSVAIIGAGGLGLGLVACAHRAGCQNITLIEPSEYRRTAARSLGATALKERASKNDMSAFDNAFDTVGSTDAKNTAIALTKKLGTCTFLGFETPLLEVNVSEAIRHQKVLRGAFVFSKKQFLDAIALVNVCESEWVTMVAMEDVESLLQGFLSGDFSLVKAALQHR